MLAVVANVFSKARRASRHTAGFVLPCGDSVSGERSCGRETNYVSATPTLYVSIYNLFSSLLQLVSIFGGGGLTR